MVDLLVKLLGPTLYNLGVSEADLISYLTQLEGYIYAIIAAVVVLVSCDVPCSPLQKKGISLCSSS